MTQQNVGARLKGAYNSLNKTEIVVIAAVLVILVWYAVGGLANWYDSRDARNEASAQKAIAEQAAKDAAAAHALADQKQRELDEQKGRADALEQKAAELEQERTGLLTELGAAHSATETARQSYNVVRSGRAPRRPPAATPDEARKRRLAELCALYPDDPQCK